MRGDEVVRVAEQIVEDYSESLHAQMRLDALWGSARERLLAHQRSQWPPGVRAQRSWIQREQDLLREVRIEEENGGS